MLKKGNSLIAKKSLIQHKIRTISEATLVTHSQQNGGTSLKKFRGKKRYFRKLRSTVEHFQADVDDDSWYDYWHRHLDFCGLGNDSLKIRRAHIKAHILLYTRIL